MPIQYKKEDAVLCWPAAEYDATLEGVEDTTSKSSGNPMQVLTWRVFHPDGREQLVSDYIVIPSGTFKLKQLAVALGKKQEFESETFQADNNIGANVIAELVIEQQEGFDDKNKIKRVRIVAKENSAQARPGPSQRPPKAEPQFDPDRQMKDDDIPFAWQGRDSTPI